MFSLSGFPLYPIRLLYAEIKNGSDNIPLYYENPLISGWGNTIDVEYENVSLIGGNISIKLLWFSPINNRIFCCISNINLDEEILNKYCASIIIGLSPCGEVVFWAGNEMRSEILAALIGPDITASISDDTIKSFNLEDVNGKNIDSIAHLRMDTLSQYELPPIDSLRKELECGYVEGCMKQYFYRYVVKIESKKDLDSVKVQMLNQYLCDGTHYKDFAGELLQYKKLGRPQKLKLTWVVNKIEFSAHFKFDDQETHTFFEKIYGIHPDTKTDIIIDIDLNNSKYDIYIYRYGQKEPVFFPKKTYQLIVFKSGFECYRSENYNSSGWSFNW